MGILGSTISVVAFTFLRPLMVLSFLECYFCLFVLNENVQMSPKAVVRVHDTRGVLCVHGLPGFLAAIAGIVATAIASQSPLVFGTPYAILFPRSYAAGYQAAALVKRETSRLIEISNFYSRRLLFCLLWLEVF